VFEISKSEKLIVVGPVSNTYSYMGITGLLTNKYSRQETLYLKAEVLIRSAASIVAEKITTAPKFEKRGGEVACSIHGFPIAVTEIAESDVTGSVPHWLLP